MNSILKHKLAKSKIIIATHVLADGPAIFLEEYLQGKIASLMFIGHPFADRKKLNSFYKLYAEGEVIKEGVGLGWNLPVGLMQIKEAFYTFWWVFGQKQEFQLFIGSDNYMAYLGLILKRLGRVEDVILYTIDYVPKRFSNPIMNFLYHYFDRQCLKNCKAVWNVSEKIALAREEFDQLSRSETVPQITVPLGIRYNEIPRVSFNKRNKNTIVFMGHIRENQGLDIVIKAMPYIVKKIPSVKLVVVGTGPLLKEIKKLATQLKIAKQVDFKGYVESHLELESILARSSVAVAIYKPDPSNFTYFADPGKVKNYLGAGLPVFITDVPAIAKVIVRENCAVMCEYDSKDVAEKIVTLLKDTKRLKNYSDKALLYAKQFDWNKIFSETLEKSL